MEQIYGAIFVSILQLQKYIFQEKRYASVAGARGERKSRHRHLGEFRPQEMIEWGSKGASGHVRNRAGAYHGGRKSKEGGIQITETHQTTGPHHSGIGLPLVSAHSTCSKEKEEKDNNLKRDTAESNTKQNKQNPNTDS